jgi:hypothetical protein
VAEGLGPLKVSPSRSNGGLVANAPRVPRAGMWMLEGQPSLLAGQSRVKGRAVQSCSAALCIHSLPIMLSHQRAINLPVTIAVIVFVVFYHRQFLHYDYSPS